MPSGRRISSPWTTSSTSRVFERRDGSRRPRRRFAKPLQRLLRCGAARAFDPARVLPVEVEPRAQHVGGEAESGGASDVDQVGHHVVHGPPRAEGGLLPQRGVEAGEVIDQRRAFGMHERPDVVAHNRIDPKRARNSSATLNG